MASPELSCLWDQSVAARHETTVSELFYTVTT